MTSRDASGFDADALRELRARERRYARPERSTPGRAPELTCSHCGWVVTLRFRGALAGLRKMGWTGDGPTTRCPSCSVAPKAGFPDNRGWQADPKRGGDASAPKQLFLVERRETETGPAIKSYGPFDSRGLADHVARRAIEKHVAHVVVVIPLDPEET